MYKYSVHAYMQRITFIAVLTRTQYMNPYTRAEQMIIIENFRAVVFWSSWFSIAKFCNRQSKWRM